MNSESKYSESKCSSDGEGSFASFQIDMRNKNYGWKHYPLNQSKLDEGARLHALSEKLVLDFLKDKKELKESIAHIYDHQIDNKSLQLKMDNVSAESLLDILNSKGKMTVELAIKLTSKLLYTLSILHSKYNITHGDLKPDNIMLNSKKNPVLIDWGCSSWDENIFNREIGTGNIQCASPQLLKRLLGKKSKYNAKKNDVFAICMILSMIWTSVQTSGKVPQSALGKDWDTFCEMEEIGDNELLKFHEALVEMYQSDESEIPSYFSKLPACIKEVLTAGLCKNEKKRPEMIDMYRALYSSTIVKGGKTYKFCNYMENLDSLKFETTIKSKQIIPKSNKELIDLWTKPTKSLRKVIKTNQKVKK